MLKLNSSFLVSRLDRLGQALTKLIVGWNSRYYQQIVSF